MIEKSFGSLLLYELDSAKPIKSLEEEKAGKKKLHVLFKKFRINQ